MKRTTRKLMLGFGMSAALLAFATGQSRAQDWNSCDTTTIAHRSASCVTASVTARRTSLSITNECSSLGPVAVEIGYKNMGGDGNYEHISFVRRSSDTSLVGGGTYGHVRCCSSQGICQTTDCDTTNGVIDDFAHRTHCDQINNSTGRVKTEGMEITNGQITVTR